MANTLTFGGINLLDSSGFMLADRGYLSGAARKRPTIESSQFGSGGKLRSVRSENIVETIRLVLTSTSLDAMATSIQGLNAQLKLAEEYHTTGWQTTPVQIVAKLWGETSSRYSTIFWGRLTFAGSPYQEFTRYQDQIEMELTFEREPFWKSQVAATKTLTGVQTITGGTVADGAHQFVGNIYNDVPPLHIKVDDGGVFGSDLVASSSFDLLPSTPAVNDAIYFGGADPFHSILFQLSVLCVDVTGIWEFWNGTDYVSAEAGGWDGTNHFEGYTGQVSTGFYAFYAGHTGLWATTAVDGDTVFWIRFRVTAVGASPATGHAIAKVAFGTETYVELAADQIDGDADALTKFWISMKADPDSDGSMSAIGEIICGMKSRGLDELNTTHFMADGPPPTDWDAPSNGADTAAFTNANYPNGQMRRCTFSGTAGAADRLTFTCTDDGACDDWVGSYQAFLLCYQISGSAGDIEVELSYEINNSGDVIYLGWNTLQRVETDADDEMCEVVNLGRLDIPPIVRSGDTDHTVDMTAIDLNIRALSNNADTPDLHIGALVLIPIDEMVFRASRPEGTGSWTFAMTPDHAVVVDGGTSIEGAQLLTHGGWESDSLHTPEIEWQLRSNLPFLPPDKVLRFFFLPIQSYAVGGVPMTSIHYGFYVAIYVQERWYLLRGGD